MTTAPDSDLLRRIATNLRLVRERKGLTREQLGASTDVDPQMIKRIEVGRANPALVIVSRLAAALMLSASMLLSGDAAAIGTIDSPVTAAPFESDEVGETIASLRRQRQISRRALARRADMRPITLGRYESGKVDARLLSVEPLANALGIGPEELVRAIERRAQLEQPGDARWREVAAGVRSRLVSATGRTQLLEWRIAPLASVDEEAPAEIEDEIVTAIRGVVVVHAGDETHRLRRGASLALPADRARRFANGAASTARLLRFQVRK